jgi:hypothetical protein
MPGRSPLYILLRGWVGHTASLDAMPRAVMGKLRPVGQTRPPERFYPARDMIPNLTNEKKKN